MQEQLIQKFKDGDKRAGDDFYNANLALVYKAMKTFRTYSIDKEEKLALINQAFAKSMEVFDPSKGKFSTYFMRSASGHIGTFIRDRIGIIRAPRENYKTTIPCDSLDKVIYNSSDGADITIKDKIAIEEDYTEIESLEMIETLNEKSKYIFVLYHLKDCSQEKIAKMLGMSQVAVSRDLIKSKESLKIILKEVV